MWPVSRAKPIAVGPPPPSRARRGSPPARRSACATGRSPAAAATSRAVQPAEVRPSVGTCDPEQGDDRLLVATRGGHHEERHGLGARARGDVLHRVDVVDAPDAGAGGGARVVPDGHGSSRRWWSGHRPGARRRRTRPARSRPGVTADPSLAVRSVAEAAGPARWRTGRRRAARPTSSATGGAPSTGRERPNALGSAPRSSRAETIRASPCQAARNSGLTPSGAALGSAPASSRVQRAGQVAGGHGLAEPRVEVRTVLMELAEHVVPGGRLPRGGRRIGGMGRRRRCVARSVEGGRDLGVVRWPGAGVEEVVDDPGVAAAGRGDERGLVVARDPVGVGAVLEQDAHRDGTVEAGGAVEGRESPTRQVRRRRHRPRARR